MTFFACSKWTKSVGGCKGPRDTAGYPFPRQIADVFILMCPSLFSAKLPPARCPAALEKKWGEAEAPPHCSETKPLVAHRLQGFAGCVIWSPSATASNR